jgi:hypothetical protein
MAASKSSAQMSLSMASAKEKMIDLIASGLSVKEAAAGVGRGEKAYFNWRATDPEFKKRIDDVRSKRTYLKRSDVVSIDEKLMSFAEWRKRYLRRETYTHQQQWIDVLEGREPANLHTSSTYIKARSDRVIINTPPYHAKSTIITQEYVVYRICMNPQIRVCIISKTQQKSKKFIYSIKKMLTGFEYAELQKVYGPADGYKDKESAWTASQIYIAGRDSAEKDPTVEVLGIRGDIYGGRYDLIILDDCVTKENANEWEKQLEWLNQEVASRVYNGKILIVGTRVSTRDLYSELMNPDNFTSGRSVWTCLRQPAVLEYADTPEEWVTLWPRSNQPLDAEAPDEPDEEGRYPAWDGPKLKDVRDSVKVSTWSLVYQQEQIAEDAIFDPVCVNGSVNRLRKSGPLRAGAFGHPRHGMEGQYVIASMDPAMTNDTFTLVGAIDRNDKMRRIMNCWVKTTPTPAYIRTLIKDVTVEYGVHEWVIEQNAFQLFLIHDEDIRAFCQSKGVRITPHYTSRNKADPDFGVASVAPLFGSVLRHESGLRKGMDFEKGSNLIELPDMHGNEGIKALIDQLVTWEPGRLGKDLKQDGPMALWFFELRARALLGDGRAKRTGFVENPYLSRGDRKSQTVVPIEAYRFAAQG